MKKQDRQGVRTPAQLEQKYNLNSHEEVSRLVTELKHRLSQAEISFGQGLSTMETEILRKTGERLEAALRDYVETGDFGELSDAVASVADVYRVSEFETGGGKEVGAGVGKDADKPNSFQVGWDAEFDRSVKRTGNKYAFSSPGSGGINGFVRMARITIKGEGANMPLSFVFTRRGAPSPMTVHACFKDVTSDNSALSSFTYEGTNYAAYLVKYSAMVWDMYVLKGSMDDEITLQDWWTSPAMGMMTNVSFPGDLVDTVPLGMEGYHRAMPFMARNILDSIMPVGFVLTLYSQADPNNMYPGTKWERLENTFLWACDANGQIGLRGGEKTHTLTIDELPVHSHGAVYSGNVSGTKNYAWYATAGDKVGYNTISAGGGQAHNNMPPYIQVAVWRRTE